MKKAHENNIIHCDLNLSYIFLDENFEPKIANFGSVKTALNQLLLCRELPTGLGYKPTITFTPDDDENFTKEFDLFSFGFLVFQMFSDNSSPFKRNAMRGKPLKKPNAFNDSYWELIMKCINVDPSKRPSFSEIVEELKDDKFAINEFGMKTDLDNLHEYQDRIDSND